MVTPRTNFNDLPLVLRIEHMVELLGLSKTKIYRELRSGTFQPPPLPGYPYRWRRVDVIEFLEQPRRTRVHPLALTHRLVIGEHDRILKIAK